MLSQSAAKSRNRGGDPKPETIHHRLQIVRTKLTHQRCVPCIRLRLTDADSGARPRPLGQRQTPALTSPHPVPRVFRPAENHLPARRCVPHVRPSRFVEPSGRHLAAQQVTSSRRNHVRRSLNHCDGTSRQAHDAHGSRSIAAADDFIDLDLPIDPQRQAAPLPHRSRHSHLRYRHRNVSGSMPP